MKHTLVANRVDAIDELEKRIAFNAKEGDTFEIIGLVPINRPFAPIKPVHFNFAPGSGFMVGENGIVHTRGFARPEDDKPWSSVTDPSFEPVAENQSFFVTRASAAHRVNVGSWVFLYSRDALADVTPHDPKWIQSPGECHQVAAVEYIDTGRVRIHLRETFRDAMTQNCQWNVRETSGWENMHWDGMNIMGAGNRTLGRCLEIKDCPGIRLNVTTTVAGSIAVNSPAVRIWAAINGQSKPRDHYGIVMGAPCSDFHVTATGYGCRHVVDTVGGHPLYYPRHSIATNNNIGTPWGTFDVQVKGEYHAPVSTHACGNGIVIKGRADVVRTFDAAELAPNHGVDTQVCLIRSRNSDLSQLKIRGSGENSIGVYSTAKGTILPLTRAEAISRHVILKER